jgi:hypothetical protein
VEGYFHVLVAGGVIGCWSVAGVSSTGASSANTMR